jgi:hypothetical protein
MAEDAFYSRELSPEARNSLVDFVEAYLDSLKSQRADRKAEIAKTKAQAVLETDIDILNFVTLIAIMHSPSGVDLMMQAVTGPATSRKIATMLVGIFEEGRRQDISSRTN